MTDYTQLVLWYGDNYYEPNEDCEVDIANMYLTGNASWTFEVSKIDSRDQMEGDDFEAAGGVKIQGGLSRRKFTLKLAPFTYDTKIGNPENYRDKPFFTAKHLYLQNVTHPEKIHETSMVIKINLVESSYENLDGEIFETFEVQKVLLNKRWNE